MYSSDETSISEKKHLKKPQPLFVEKAFFSCCSPLSYFIQLHGKSLFATIISKLLKLRTQALQGSSNIHAMACIQSSNVGITAGHSIHSPNGHKPIKGPNFFIQWSLRRKPDHSTPYSNFMESEAPSMAFHRLKKAYTSSCGESLLFPPATLFVIFWTTGVRLRTLPFNLKHPLWKIISTTGVLQL